MPGTNSDLSVSVVVCKPEEVKTSDTMNQEMMLFKWPLRLRVHELEPGAIPSATAQVAGMA